MPVQIETERRAASAAAVFALQRLIEDLQEGVIPRSRILGMMRPGMVAWLSGCGLAILADLPPDQRDQEYQMEKYGDR